MTNAEKREKYRNDPVYRQERLDKAKSTQEAYSKYKEYRTLVQLRKDVYRLRESLIARQKHAAELEKRLIMATKKKATATKAWNKLKAKIQGKGHQAN